MNIHTAYLSLGSNIEPKFEHLMQAVEKLTSHLELEVTRLSSVYETAPVGYSDQDNFLNLTLELETNLLPLDLLDYCQVIEKELKRVRLFKNGPRTIDLDIIAYDQEIIEDTRLLVPHPRMHERAFVLFPLAEIAPDLEVAGLNQTVMSLRDALSEADKKDVKIIGDLYDNLA